MTGLRWKLVGALVAIALIGIVLMAFLTNLNTTNQIRNYIQSGNVMYYHKLASDLGRFYQVNKSWQGVEGLLDDSLRINTDRLVLSDAEGQIVGDTADLWLRQTTAGLSLENGIAITAAGKELGQLYVYSTTTAGTNPGKGKMGWHRETTGNVSAAVVQDESTLLNQIDRYLWVAGLISFLTAILLGVFLTRQITRPLNSLTRGADQIARGNLQYRVKINTRDEVGDLGRSFNSMADNLEKSEQARKRLVSDVTHELRTPLTIIEGTVDGMIDGVFPADHEHLNNIKEQSTLLTRLVADLRDLSLAESGQLKMQKTAVNLSELAKSKISQFASLAAEKRIVLALEPSADMPEIEADIMRIDQVLTNLLSNAIRHTPTNGKITLSLSTTTTTEKRRWALVSVTDTGEGIAAEHLPHIFDRFYRVENSRSRSEGGAGLGLAIVKQMVEAHGGRVEVFSQPGRGSTFTLHLPVE